MAGRNLILPQVWQLADLRLSLYGKRWLPGRWLSLPRKRGLAGWAMTRKRWLASRSWGTATRKRRLAGAQGWTLTGKRWLASRWPALDRESWLASMRVWTLGWERRLAGRNRFALAWKRRWLACCKGLLALAWERWLVS